MQVRTSQRVRNGGYRRCPRVADVSFQGTDQVIKVLVNLFAAAAGIVRIVILIVNAAANTTSSIAFAFGILLDDGNITNPFSKLTLRFRFRRCHRSGWKRRNSSGISHLALATTSILVVCVSLD